jgi:hypothetical protein
MIYSFANLGHSDGWKYATSDWHSFGSYATNSNRGGGQAASDGGLKQSPTDVVAPMGTLETSARNLHSAPVIPCR